LCFAHEGYKQPQQLLVLSYFLSRGQQFDAVINIDGFNEIALASINDARGFEFSMPSAHHLEPLINLADPATLTPAKVASLASIQRDKERLNGLASRINAARLASVHFVLTHYFDYVERRFEAETARFLPSSINANSVIQVTRRTNSEARSDLLDAIAANWAAASAAMHDLLAARDVPYYHVLQPNQYFGTRRFSAEEARIAIDARSPYKANIPEGYERLRARATESRGASRERFIDGTHLFDGTSEPVYMDNCCHYTLLGNRLLADALAARMIEGASENTRDETP
jgi:hypothetical protein